MDGETGNFQISASAEAELRELPGPIYIVAVHGKMRSGKSTLLNMLASIFGAPSKEGSNKDKPWCNFRTQSGSKSITKGIHYCAFPVTERIHEKMQFLKKNKENNSPENYEVEPNQYQSHLLLQEARATMKSSGVHLVEGGGSSTFHEADAGGGDGEQGNSTDMAFDLVEEFLQESQTSQNQNQKQTSEKEQNKELGTCLFLDSEGDDCIHNVYEQKDPATLNLILEISQKL